MSGKPARKDDLLGRLKRYFLTGLLVVVPLAITVWVVHAIISTMDRSLELLPDFMDPNDRLSDIPGIGAILTLLVILGMGMIASNMFGERLLRLGENLLMRIPVFRTIYNGVKQVSDTLLKPGGQAFRKAALVRWPHADSWTIAFITGRPGGDVVNYLDSEDYVSVYVPTTPNPTGGYFVMIKRSDVVELDMSVDEALKYVISMGVVSPKPGPSSVLPKA